MKSQEVIRAARGVLICVTRHGYVCANAGVDASNVPGEDAVLMLPLDPDGSARALAGAPARADRGRPGGPDQRLVRAGLAHGPVRRRDRLRRPRARSRTGAGGVDTQGRELQATVIATADELAAAADAARRKDGAQPVVLIRGAQGSVTTEDGPGAAALVRPPEQDLFR